MTITVTAVGQPDGSVLSVNSEIGVWKAPVTIYVNDYGATGDGVTDDGPAIQAAIAAAEALVVPGTNDRTFQGGVTVFFPHGDYRTTSPLLVGDYGVCLSGDDGRGARISADGCSAIKVGDYTNTYRLRGVWITNLVVRASSPDNTNVGIELYRTVGARIKDCEIIDFGTGVYSINSGTSLIASCLVLSNDRVSVHGTAGLLVEGTDESDWTPSESYSPGGGMHVTDCEFIGGYNTDGYGVQTGILARSYDGLYITQCHFIGYTRNLYIAPLATGASYHTGSIYVTNCYFDECYDRVELATNTANIHIGGSVDSAVLRENEDTTRSTYQGINFTNCLVRAPTSLNAVLVAVTDASSSLDYQSTDGNKFNNISFTGCTFLRSLSTIFRVLGANSGAYCEPIGLVLSGCTFSRYNSNAVQGVGAAINMEVQSATLVGNHIGPGETVLDEYIVRVLLRDSGATDVANANAILSSNNLVDAYCTSGDYLWVTRTTGSLSSFVENIFPGGGYNYDQVHTLTTTDAATQDLRTYAIIEGQAGRIQVWIIGTSGTKSVAYEYYAGFRRATGGAAALSTGTTTATEVRAWNPDSIATPPTVVLATNTLKVQVTGVAAETWDWSAKVQINTAA